MPINGCDLSRLHTHVGTDAFFDLFAFMTYRTYRKGELLWKPGETVARGMYLVVEGSIGTFASDPSKIMCSFPRYESVGEFDLITGLPSCLDTESEQKAKQLTTHAVGCVCLENSMLYFLSREQFDAFVRKVSMHTRVF